MKSFLSDTRGFTLLEVIIAMSIMTIAFASILAVEGGSINATIRAKQINIVTMLAKNQMIETEFKIQGKTFDEVRKEESGTFDPPYESYKWKTIVKELKFPALNMPSSGGKSGEDKPDSGGGSGQQNNLSTELLTKVISNFLSKALREVTVTVSWAQGKSEQSYSLSTYWVDLNYAINLSE